MIWLQIVLLSCFAFLGLLANWLLILAIQRKTYHYQYSHRNASPNPNPNPNRSILGNSTSICGQLVQTPLIPTVRSSISIFDKFILAFLVNDLMVCNFLLPLRMIDLSFGLPCGFFCFMFTLLEKFSTIAELIILNLLLVTSLFFFWKERLLTAKLWSLAFLLSLPLVFAYLSSSLTYLDVDEFSQTNPFSTCQQTFVYIHRSTQESINIFCCSISYVLLAGDLLLLLRMKSYIQSYQQSQLENFTNSTLLSRSETTNNEQIPGENHRRRSMHPSILTHQSITMDSTAPNATPPVQRPQRSFDYLTFLTMNENSETLVRSSYLILILYFLVHIPYWSSELTKLQRLNPFKDIFYLSHICKPFCYLLTNEKYRHHVWAILQCKTFRMLPNLLRRKSRVMKLNATNLSMNSSTT